MLFYHRGIAAQTSAAKRGRLFVSRVSILEEDGEATSLGDLGHFANRQAALAFAVLCATAFADDQPMPKPPCEIRRFSRDRQSGVVDGGESATTDEHATNESS